MVKYRVKITPQAFRDIDMIYDYIARHLLEPGTANNLVDEIEAGIFSLEEMPNRGAPRRIGTYANKGYRQLFIKNYTISDKETASLFHSGHSRKFSGIERIALRKLDMINAVVTVETLKVPPGNRLEALKGNRQGQYSVRVNEQWRICFRWEGRDAYDVEIVDYH